MKKLNKIYKEILNEYISPTGLKNIEDELDNEFKPLNIDIEFSQHFHDRLNDPRNGEAITAQELMDTFNRLYTKYGTTLINHKDLHAAVQDFNNNLNIPFHLTYDKGRKMFELTNKTIMRKPPMQFHTQDRKLKV